MRKRGGRVDGTYNREADAVVHLAETLDVVVCTWFLAAELIAGKAEDNEVVYLFLPVSFVYFPLIYMY